MKLRKLTLVLAAAALLLAQADTTLQRAIRKETVEGDLKGAIELYQKAISQAGKDRATAAQALLRLGDCYEKQGDKQARQAYERLVKEFGDSKEASQARVKLAAMGGGGNTGGPGAHLAWKIPRSVWYEGQISAISPDGRYIAFVENAWNDRRSTDVTLQIHDLVTETNRTVTVADDTDAVFSPDGKQLAFLAKANGDQELRVINTDGTGMRVLLRNKGRLVGIDDWSPDGKHILVDAHEIVPPAPGGRGTSLADQPPTDIALVSISDGSMQVVKSAKQVRVHSFSPDGKYILYSVGTGQAGNRSATLFALSADGKTESLLLAEDWGSRSAYWTPDGRRLVFSSKRSGAPGLWGLRVANGKPEGEPELLASTEDQPIGFARDGSLFYYVWTGLEDVYVAGLDPATGRITSEPKRVNEGFVGRARGPLAWSPDGALLALRKVNQQAQQPTIVLHTVDSGKDRDFPVDRLGPGGPWFFPDGLSLMFAGAESPNWRRLDIRTGETTETWKSPVAGPGPLGSAFSRDPRVRFGFRKNEGTDCQGENCLYPLVRVDMAKSEVTTITQVRAAKADLLDISISPDDTQLAIVVANSDGNESFQVVPTAGGTPREVYRGGKGFLNGGTAWTKDGKHILAFSRPSDRPVLYSLPVAGGAPVISSLPFEPGFNAAPMVSPDGTRVAIGATQEKDDLWVMTGLSGPAPAAR